MTTRDVRRAVSSDELSRVEWRISSRSTSGGGNCVEAGSVRDGSGRVALRHSHHPEGRVLVYTDDAWAAFINGIKRGGLDFT